MQEFEETNSRNGVPARRVSLFSSTFSDPNLTAPLIDGLPFYVPMVSFHNLVKPLAGQGSNFNFTHIVVICIRYLFGFDYTIYVTLPLQYYCSSPSSKYQRL